MATLIRAYADRAHAQRLHQELLDAGLSGDRVRLLHGEQGSASTHAQAGSNPGHEPGDRGVLSSLGHFFASALGGDSPQEDQGRFTDALHRGETVIAVDARTSADESLARAILDGSPTRHAQG